MIIDLKKVVAYNMYGGKVTFWLDGINDAFLLRGAEARNFVEALGKHDLNYQGKIWFNTETGA